jgi:manganese transport protein
MPSVSVTVPAQRRPWLAYLGPACMVSVGYMDPGNWATDLEGGARFGHQLLWVLVLSNVMALLLQSLSAKLGLISGLDLAQACRDGYTKTVSVTLWIGAEIAIIACDLAELLGSAIALNLLFEMPLVLGAIVTSLDVLLILWLERRGAGRLEAIVCALLVTIALCLGVEVVWAKPDLAQMSAGLIPRLNGENLYVAIGILGATVMPHNLYLQSGLLRKTAEYPAPEQRRALSRSFWSTALALNLALLVNAAILVLAGTVFAGRSPPVDDLAEAHRLLAPLLGATSASILFAVGLLCSGQSATITGTIAGQLVMEGFVGLRVRPWLRRAITRGLALVPAVVVLSIAGEHSTLALLVASQVVLSLQLPFAIVPLIRLTSASHLMGEFTTRPLIRNLASACAFVVILANAALVVRLVGDLSQTSPRAASLVATFALASLVFLVWIACVPLRGATKPALAEPLRAAT